jgi:hypothetical protein
MSRSYFVVLVCAAGGRGAGRAGGFIVFDRWMSRVFSLQNYFNKIRET